MSTPQTKKPVSFAEVRRRIDRLELPPVDAVVGILEGGRVPACLLADRLDAPLFVLAINYRDEANRPRRPAPEMLHADPTLPPPSSRVLLVDDVSVSGQTFEKAKSLLRDYTLFTLVLKGDADFSLFNEVKGCIHWPWNAK